MPRGNFPRAFLLAIPRLILHLIHISRALKGQMRIVRHVHHAFIHIATFIRRDIARAAERRRSYSYEHTHLILHSTRRAAPSFAALYFPQVHTRWENLRLLNLDVKYVIDTIQPLNQVSVKITRNHL